MKKYVYIGIGDICSYDICSSHIRSETCAPVRQFLHGAHVLGAHDSERLSRGANVDGSVLFKPFESGKYKFLMLFFSNNNRIILILIS